MDRELRSGQLAYLKLGGARPCQSPTGRADSWPPHSEEQGMSGCIWGAAAKRGLGGRLREGANVYNIYTLIYTKRTQRDVLPRLGGPPVVGW